MKKIPIDIDSFTEEQVREFLEQLIDALDSLDEEDFFGTEGWYSYLFHY